MKIKMPILITEEDTGVVRLTVRTAVVLCVLCVLAGFFFFYRLGEYHQAKRINDALFIPITETN